MFKLSSSKLKTFTNKTQFLLVLKKKLCTINKRILGIETSCDDTGCAIVDTSGNILGEAINSQHLIHLNHGGIIPPIAQDLHRQNIEEIVQKTLERSGLELNDVDAIATTVKPGLPLSLLIGMKYGKFLSKKYDKPFIPVHHMEAHALTIRMIDPTVQFPFLVLLISGGHCLIALAENVDKFLLLGQSLDDAPGEAFDKTARRMKLCNIPEFSTLSGGNAIELAASKADNPSQFYFPLPLSRYRDCNFSMAGLKNTVLRHIQRQERIYDVEPDQLIPGVYNLCAGFQFAITKHICHRVQRAMQFVEMKKLLPQEKTLVISGGVACNDFIINALNIICKEMGFKCKRPPPKLCTDNGVMIAWNGVERWKIQSGLTRDLASVDIDAKAPFGINIIQDVKDADIKCERIKLKKSVEINKFFNMFLVLFLFNSYIFIHTFI